MEQTSGSVGFTIQLDDCDLTTGANPKCKNYIFGDPAVTGKTNVLALQNSASGAATNVGDPNFDDSSKVSL